MNYNLLNNMINYIEDNLTEKIDYNKLAKIVGVSEYALQRIFIFMTNISISEYIRKRRLSSAFEELKMNDIKIIDIAIKYKYESSISFSRAFKQNFGITPSECKKSKANYKLFPIIKFNNRNYLCNEYNYEIKECEEIVLYCYGVKAETKNDLLYRIRELYLKLISSDIHDRMNKVGMYGISFWNNNEYIYYIGSTKKFDNSEKIIIPRNKYAVFNVGARTQEKIVELEELIYSQWNNSTKYKILNGFEFELYKDEICYLYIPIEDKQK